MTLKEAIEQILDSYACDYEVIGSYYRIPNYGGLSASTLEELEDNIRDYTKDVAVIEEDSNLTLVIHIDNGDKEVSAPFGE
jgi:arabinogalactan endo-1,4-beta-galactosidase